jgi:signal transduction histidine kinase
MRRDRAPPYRLTMTISPVGWRRRFAGLLAEAAPDADEVPRPRRSPRDWVVDVVCFLLAAGLVTLTYVDGRDQVRGPVPLAVDVTLGGLCCLGVWLRRRWPVGLAVTAIAFSVVSAAAAWVAVIALFTVAVHRRLAVVGLVTAGATAACVGSVLIGLDTSTPLWQAALSIVFFATVVAWGMFIRARRQLAHSLRERQLRAEHDHLAQVRRQERLRIAREMHDVLAHRISLVSLHAGALELRPDRPADEIARAAGVIRDSAHEALEELRAVIGVLRADPVDDRAATGGWADDAPQRPQPTLADLPELAAESRQAGTRVELDCRVADPAAVPVGVGRSAYRIVQEGLTNARKHAHGADVWVTVAGSCGNGLTVEIRNPLPPDTAYVTAIPGAGSGIVGLAERASLAGGRLEHGRTPTGDFQLRAWLPWTA